MIDFLYEVLFFREPIPGKTLLFFLGPVFFLFLEQTPGGHSLQARHPV
ncbi:Hypothetical protein Minf_2309 [Methylacidiphilum infernorum V4]|uniref:Uncharacterized protein n=1 Tax=Methylacidiphilum infernorum (isolate V4) TaxID=481448 RepID=B3E0D4_METI4|nr:Hypothetical protein Minf_2309 [Methylacidiphilum infernorum V4]